VKRPGKQDLLILAGIAAVFIYLKSKGIGAFKETKFLPPYTDNGKTTFRALTWQRPGVYIIKENGKIVYIGHSRTNLYKTLYRHFQQWDHPAQKVTTYAGRMNSNTYTVRVILTTAARAPQLEGYLVNKYEPRDNEVKLQLFRESKAAQNTYEAYQEEAEEINRRTGPAPF
jgi:hypothetical protein